MKLFSTTLAALALLAAAVNGATMLRQEQEGGSSTCTLSGTYKAGTDISSCSTVTIGSLSVPAGVTLDLSKTKSGATIEFTGTTTFGTQLWEGPLVLLSGSDLTVKGSGTLDGQGAWTTASPCSLAPTPSSATTTAAAATASPSARSAAPA
ncbi:unnamed protein product [Phytophthora lilii]|uniref:Unnamed protein product n=1 Tax=Phytophthora lilii TaxID=2077276 RepID=A0A9W6X9J8_9STRA|nr:unnamed protein product [Phytophthora lilii]